MQFDTTPIQFHSYSYKYIIDQGCSVKMVSYWPGSFFGFYGERRSRVEKKTLKKSWGQYHAIFDQTSLVYKGFTIWPKRVIFSLAGQTRKIASGQDRPILPALVANPKAWFASYYPLADSATIIIENNIKFSTLVSTGPASLSVDAFSP